MPNQGFGDKSIKRIRQLVEALLDYALNDSDRISKLHASWKDNSTDLSVKATLVALQYLLRGKDGFKPTEKTSDKQTRLYIGEVLTDYLRDRLKILEDHRPPSATRGNSQWSFTLKLWSKDKDENLRKLAEFCNCQPSSTVEINGKENAEPVTEKRVIGLAAIPSVPVWKGRDELLEKLKAKLTGLETDSLTSSPKVLAIIGQGGIGKTSLAVKLLEVIGVNLRSPLAPLNKGGIVGNCLYDCVMYFKVQEGTSFDDVAEFLLDGLGIETAETLKSAEEKIGRIIAGLAEIRCLLLLDNLETILHPANDSQGGKAIAPDWGKLLNALVYQQHCSQTILTSREVPADLADSRYDGAEPDSELVHIETLTGVDIEAGVEILQQRQLRDNLSDLEWVSLRVEGHVFLLTQLAAIGKGKPGFLRKHPELVTKKAEPILTEQLARQSAAARDLLKRMCVLRVPIDVPGLTFLRLYTGDEEKDRRLLAAANSGEPAEFTDEEIEETEAILERLVDSSLVQEHYDEDKCELFYDLHRVIVEFLQEEYRYELLNPFKSAYSFYLSGRNVENFKNIDELQPILQAFFFSWLLERYNVAASLLLTTIDKYLRRWGYWNSLKVLYEEILPHITGNLRLKCLDAIGLLYLDLGELDLAKKYFNEALALIKDEDCVQTQIIKMSLFKIKADEMLQEAYRVEEEQTNDFSKKVGNNDTYDKNIENLEYQKNKVHEQLLNPLRQVKNSIEKVYEDIIERNTTEFSLEVVAIAMAALGKIRIIQGDFETAKDLLIKALSMFEELQIQKSIAETNYDLAQLYRQRNNTELAQQHYNTAHQIFQQLGAAKDLERIAREWEHN
ncbi:MAG: tetratricopeptide repeat protein [Phormidium sp.]